MLQHFIILCLLYYLSSGVLRESVKNKRKFQTFSPKSDRGRLRDLFPYNRFQV